MSYIASNFIIMEPVYQFSHNHNDKTYLIKIEKAPPIHHRVSVFSEDSSEPIYTYPLSIKSYDQSKPKWVRHFWFWRAGKAFDFINNLS